MNAGSRSCRAWTRQRTVRRRHRLDPQEGRGGRCGPMGVGMARATAAASYTRASSRRAAGQLPEQARFPTPGSPRCPRSARCRPRSSPQRVSKESAASPARTGPSGRQIRGRNLRPARRTWGRPGLALPAWGRARTRRSSNGPWPRSPRVGGGEQASRVSDTVRLSARSISAPPETRPPGPSSRGWRCAPGRRHPARSRRPSAARAGWRPGAGGVSSSGSMPNAGSRVPPRISSRRPPKVRILSTISSSIRLVSPVSARDGARVTR